MRKRQNRTRNRISVEIATRRVHAFQNEKSTLNNHSQKGNEREINKKKSNNLNTKSNENCDTRVELH